MGWRFRWGEVAPTVGGALLTVLGLLEIWVSPSEGMTSAERLVESALLAMSATALAVWKRSAVLVSLVVLTTLGLMSSFLIESRAWGTVAVMSCSYLAARHAARRGAAVVLAVGLGYAAFAVSLEDNAGPWMYLGNFLFVAVLIVITPWMAGFALRRRHQLSSADAERATQMERLRIARELHDVVGHALGVIVVQAEGERAQLGDDADDSTRETLATIADCARDALNDVRRLLQVMRSDQDLPPQPGLDALPQLRAAMASCGLPTDVVVDGEQRPLPPALDLSAYRIVQEALTNTLRHSRNARSLVSLRYADNALDIEVIDDGQPVRETRPRGYGLVGMRERIALFGGDMTAGPRPGGGFGVRVHLPIERNLVDDLSSRR